MNKYANACSEVYAILKELNEEEYNKIPFEIITVIDENRNRKYIFKLDEKMELKEQKMLQETKAILFNIFRDYLATSEQKEKIIRTQNKQRYKNEIRKHQIYNVDVFENRRKEKNIQLGKERAQMLEYKENMFKKILNKIREFFKMK